MKRRSLLTALPLLAAGAFASDHSFARPRSAAAPARRLQYRADGSFKILAISDLHYIPEPNRPALALTEKLIALEKPDLVIVTGDNISGDRCVTPDDVRAAIGNVASVMEQMKTPWAVVLGNHDQDHFAKTNLPRDRAFSFYETHPYNMNGDWVRDISGVGNKNLLIWNATGSRPVSNIWLVDSGGRAADPALKYEWIHADQVAWYWRSSKALEAQFGGKVPSLMFFHIPLPEFGEMIRSRKILGERHEPESPSMINGGMFGAVLDRGDVMGIFCGHDHVNNYVGKYNGVMLGQNGVVGYHGYPHTPPEDSTNDRARGGRVFLLDEAAPGKFKTWMRFRDGTTNWESWSDAYANVELK